MTHNRLIITILACLVIIWAIIHLWKTDMIDRTHPYGLDMARNKKYENLVGERYGVSVFWGKPNQKDKPNDNLNKIEWLADSHITEVNWRRAMVATFILLLILFVLVDYENFLDIRKFLICVPFTFLAFYFSSIYYSHHVIKIKSSYFKSHVRKLKRFLKLSLYNPLQNKIT